VAGDLSADPRSIKRVIFCCFSAESADHHAAAFGDLGLV
jgi:hypothetical protein